jgi:hypothetical protein
LLLILTAQLPLALLINTVLVNPWLAGTYNAALIAAVFGGYLPGPHTLRHGQYERRDPDVRALLLGFHDVAVTRRGFCMPEDQSTSSFSDNGPDRLDSQAMR